MTIALVVALCSAIGLAITLAGALIWSMKRSYAGGDSLIVALGISAELRKEVDLCKISISERDRAIADLEDEIRRYRRALELSEAETPPLITKEPGSASSAIRKSMDELRTTAKAGKTPIPSILSRKTPPPAVPGAAAPGSVTGGVGVPEPIDVPGVPGRAGQAGGGGQAVHAPAAGAPRRVK